MGDSAMSLPQLKEEDKDKENDPPELKEIEPTAKQIEEEEEEAVLIPVKASTFSASPEAQKVAEKKTSDAKPKQTKDNKLPEKKKPAEPTKKAQDPESVPLVIPKKTVPSSQATKPKPPKSTKKTEQEDDTTKTPMIKSAAAIKISKDEQMKLQNQKIADDFFEQEQKENQMLVMRLPNTVGGAGSDGDSDDEASSSPSKKMAAPGRGNDFELGVVHEEVEESQQEAEGDEENEEDVMEENRRLKEYLQKL